VLLVVLLSCQHECRHAQKWVPLCICRAACVCMMLHVHHAHMSDWDMLRNAITSLVTDLQAKKACETSLRALLSVPGRLPTFNKRVTGD
jgi:hypothetical protein